MKLLRIIGSMCPSSGGPCQGIRHSIPELEKHAVQNEVVCLDDPHKDYLYEERFPIHALGPGKGPWCYSSKLKPWLLRNIGRFDVIIIHGLWLYPSYAVNSALRKLEKDSSGTFDSKQLPKVFIMPHGMLDPYFQHASERRLKALRNIVYWKLIESKVVNGAAGVLFTSESELQLARIPFRPYLPKQEINVGYGIAEPPPYTVEMRTAFLKFCPSLQRNPYIIYLGRIHRKKGVDLLLKAYEMAYKKIAEEHSTKTIRHKFPAFPRLVLAGPCNDVAYTREINQIVNKSNFLEKNVFFAGMLTGDAKWGAFYGCEAFVLPSHQENFGIAVVEALACSKPVMITKQVNIWREILDNNGGLVAEDTLEGVEVMLKNWKKMSKQDKKSMGQQARAVFEKYYAIAPASARLLEAIQATYI